VGAEQPLRGRKPAPQQPDGGARLQEQGAREGVGERAGRVEDVERRPRGERAVSGGERLGEQGLKARCTIAADPKPLGRLALVVDAVGRIGQQQLGRAIADPT
jgi:hypothetical protein